MGNSFDEIWNSLRSRLIRQISTATTFNQYRDIDPRVDSANAATLRLYNLREYLYVVLPTAKILVLGEAPGPWGTRFSGIPFTCERQLVEGNLPIPGKQTSSSNPDINLRKTPPYESNSAMIFWGTLSPYFRQLLVWDVYPFHPHKIGDAFSIRTPSWKEVLEYADIVKMLTDVVKPRRVLAIGRTAHMLSERIGIPARYISRLLTNKGLPVLSFSLYGRRWGGATT